VESSPSSSRSSSPASSFPQLSRLDSNPYHRNFAYLRGDNSVARKRITKDGRAFVKGIKKDFFETGPDTHWGEKPPKIHHPLPCRVLPEPKFKLLESINFIVFLMLACGPIIYYLLLKFSAARKESSSPSP
jgi:hypothetical protein